MAGQARLDAPVYYDTVKVNLEQVRNSSEELTGRIK